MEKIINKYKVFDSLIVDIKNINDNKNFIFKLYEIINNNYKLSIKMEGFYIGIYSLKYNLWSWANNSETIDKTMIKYILNFKDNLLKKNIINDIINNNYSILTSDEFIEIINIIQNNIKNKLFLVKNRDNIYIILSNIIYINNLS